jgi:hypothetical protein
VLAAIIGTLIATNYIEIINRPDRLAEVASTGAHIHNLAAVTVSMDLPISVDRRQILFLSRSRK